MILTHMEDNMKEIYDLINIDLKPLVFVGVFLILIIILLYILKAIKDHKRNMHKTNYGI